MRAVFLLPAHMAPFIFKFHAWLQKAEKSGKCWKKKKRRKKSGGILPIVIAIAYAANKKFAGKEIAFQRLSEHNKPPLFKASTWRLRR